MPLKSHLLSFAIALSPLLAEASDELPAVFHKPTPASTEDLRSIQKQIKSLIPRLSRAVVAVEVGGSTGSGVVVSSNGIVLTAAHVCGQTNREVRFTFPDGSTARGKTLGLYHDLDAGMMKINGNGPWPHAEVGDLQKTELGDWVLTLGHPGGFDKDRSVVVRLGRIIRLATDLVQTDCTLSAGDSGGPLFDMRGKVIGIHSRISDSAAENFHVPITAFQESWNRLKNGESWGDERSPRPWFGVRGTNDPAGCKVVSLEEGAPAQKSGLKVGDILRKINKHDITSYDALKRFVATAKPGDEFQVELQREGAPVSLNVKLEANPRRR